MQEIFPIFGFIAAYITAKQTGYSGQAIYWATAALMISAVLQLVWLRLRHQNIGKKHWLTTLIILIIGGVTLVLKNPMIIKWKPTITYLIFAAVLLGTERLGKGNLIQKMLGNAFKMPATLWRRLNVAWALFFTAMAALNLIVAYSFSDDFWVGFKLWGGLGGTILFVAAQIYLLRHYLEKSEPPRE